MRILDAYALNCGAKIGKPFIYESHFPLPFGKYVTFQAQTPMDSRNYAYWQDVIDMVNPILKQMDITLLQIGLPNEIGYQRVADLRGQTNFHQLAYILHRSMLHFGPDSFGVHLSSAFDTPIVALYSCSMTEVAGPHFGSKEKQILFKGYERVGNKKASCSPQENPKSINAIKPEEIAHAIFRLLGIDVKLPFETVFTGNRYSSQIIRELVPNSAHLMPMPEQPIELRFDRFFDEKLMVHHLNYWQKAIVVTDKPLPVELLKSFKSHVAAVAYHIPIDDSPEFAKQVVQAGLPLVLLSRLSPEELQEKKIKYYEFGMINRLPEPDPIKVEELRKDISNLYFRSCKLVASQGNVFGSFADLEKERPLQNDFEYRRVTDSPMFWRDLDFYTIVKKIQ